MTDHRPEGFAFEWVTIPKKRLYLLVAMSAAAAAAAIVTLYIYLHGNPFARQAPPPAEPQAARIELYEGDVRVVRASTREVLTVTPETRLAPGDVVQTQSTGRASLTLADGSALTVSPDSVVTIADNSAAPDQSRSEVRVAVERGHVRLQTAAITPGSSHAVTTPLAESRLHPQTAVSFGVRPDRSEEIRVRRGRVDTTTRSGQSAAITPGEYVSLAEPGTITRREPLLEAPAPLEPAHLATVEVGRAGHASTVLRWGPARPGNAVLFHVEVAQSPFFVAEGLLLDRRGLELPHLILGELRRGHHFWRVRAASTTGQTSEWSEPRRFTVADPPAELPPRRG